MILAEYGIYKVRCLDVEEWHHDGQAEIGIYRNLLSPTVLRDEQVRLDRFCLVKGIDDWRE